MTATAAAQAASPARSSAHAGNAGRPVPHPRLSGARVARKPATTAPPATAMSVPVVRPTRRKSGRAAALKVAQPSVGAAARAIHPAGTAVRAIG